MYKGQRYANEPQYPKGPERNRYSLSPPNNSQAKNKGKQSKEKGKEQQNQEENRHYKKGFENSKQENYSEYHPQVVYITERQSPVGGGKYRESKDQQWKKGKINYQTGKESMKTDKGKNHKKQRKQNEYWEEEQQTEWQIKGKSENTTQWKENSPHETTYNAEYYSEAREVENSSQAVRSMQQEIVKLKNRIDIHDGQEMQDRSIKGHQAREQYYHWSHKDRDRQFKKWPPDKNNEEDMERDIGSGNMRLDEKGRELRHQLQKQHKEQTDLHEEMEWIQSTKGNWMTDEGLSNSAEDHKGGWKYKKKPQYDKWQQEELWDKAEREHITIEDRYPYQRKHKKHEESYPKEKLPAYQEFQEQASLEWSPPTPPNPKHRSSIVQEGNYYPPYTFSRKTQVTEEETEKEVKAVTAEPKRVRITEIGRAYIPQGEFTMRKGKKGKSGKGDNKSQLCEHKGSSKNIDHSKKYTGDYQEGKNQYLEEEHKGAEWESEEEEPKGRQQVRQKKASNSYTHIGKMGKHSSLSEETEERADSQQSEDPHDKFTKGGKQSKVNKYNEKKGKTEGRNHPQGRSVHPPTELVYHNMSHKGNKNYKGKKVGGIIFAPLRPNQWGRNRMEVSGKSTKNEQSKHSQSNNKNKDGSSDTQIPESSQQEKNK